MKSLIWLLIPLFFISCGGEDAAEGTDETPPAVSTDADGNSWNTFRATSEDDLPDCDEDTDGQLYYISDDQEFKACDEDSNAGWVTISIQGDDGADGNDGTNGEDGTSVIINKLIDNETTDFCPGSYSTCHFNGGNYMTFSDGTLMLSPSYRQFFNLSGDTDEVIVTPTAFYPAASSAGAIRLVTTFWDGSNYVSLFIYFTRSSSTSDPIFYLYSDTDDDGVLEIATDALEVTLTTSEWSE